MAYPRANFSALLMDRPRTEDHQYAPMIHLSLHLMLRLNLVWLLPHRAVVRLAGVVAEGWYQAQLSLSNLILVAKPYVLSCVVMYMQVCSSLC